MTMLYELEMIVQHHLPDTHMWSDLKHDLDATEEEMEALALLEALLEELSDDELLEHASNMLQVFDAAAEELNLLAEDEESEEEEVVEEEEEEVDASEEDVDSMSPALMRAILKAQRREE